MENILQLFNSIVMNGDMAEEEKTTALDEAMRNRNIGRGNNLSSYINQIEDYGLVVPTGIPTIDTVLHGFTGVSILAAPPGSGKTTFALNLAERFSALGAMTVVITNDMTEEELVCKCLARNSYEIVGHRGFEAEQVLGLKNGIRERPIFKQACDRFKSKASLLTIVGDSSGTSLDGLVRLISYYGMCWHDTERIVVIIDYLQNVSADSVVGDKQKLDVLVKELKQLAKSYRLIVIAVSSVNRASYNRPLTLDSLKESGGIEYGADLVLGLQYERVGLDDFNLGQESTKSIRDMELVVLKQRFGQVGGSVKLKYLPKYDVIPCFEELPKLGKSRNDY